MHELKGYCTTKRNAGNRFEHKASDTTWEPDDASADDTHGNGFAPEHEKDQDQDH